MQIVPLDAANESDVQAWWALIDEAQRVEFPRDPQPSRRASMASLSYEWPGQHTERWLAKDRGEVLGTSTIDLPDLDNLQSAWVDVLVDVHQRRRGIGRALFEHALERSRHNGRVHVISEVREPLPGSAQVWSSAAFAQSMGIRRVLPSVRRRLEVDRIDAAVLADLARDAEAASAGYHVVTWTGSAPDQYVGDVAYLEGRMSTDPPLGGLHLEPELFDASRIRATEDATRAYGRTIHACGVVHTTTDSMVGYTLCVFDEDVPDHAWQWATIVVPEHRGHRLGLRVKLANLAWLLESAPAVRTIDTWNAAENTHMVAVNEVMGFVPIELGAEWQLDLVSAESSATASAAFASA